MKKISDYPGSLVNHLNALYRPGERALAVELAEALGLTVAEITFTQEGHKMTAIHPNADDLDTTNNIIFLTEMGPSQAKLDAVMREKIAADPEFGEAVNGYRDGARTYPDANPHFGLRYPSAKVLDPAIDRLRNNLGPALGKRVSVHDAPYYPPADGIPDIRQTFVYTDVFAVGPAAFGQIIELQIERGT